MPLSMDKFPLDLVSRILSFLDGESLLQCSCVCSDFCQLTDQRSYWENAAWKLYPHLKETYDIMPYNGDWKALFKDRNLRNRSAVFEWTVTDFLTNGERRYSPSFRVENYDFKVIVDPVGNPNVYFLDPGVSVYLACSLAKDNDQNGPAAGNGADDDNENTDDWECCCAFSLTACNQQRKGRNVTWHSSMLNDRFHKNRKNWGVHSLLPLTKLKDPASGFVVDDSLKLKVRLRLLYLTVKVIRTSSLGKHRGFGVVDTGNDDSSVLSYELFHCTTLSHFKDMLVKDLGLSSPDSLRLWVFTQPWPDTVLCPREILINEPVNTAAAGQVGVNETSDDDLNSPTLFSLLQLHMDGLGVARVWAECSDDQGFCSNPGFATKEEAAATILTNLAHADDNMAVVSNNSHHHSIFPTVSNADDMAVVKDEAAAASSVRRVVADPAAAAAAAMTRQHVPGIIRCGPGSNLNTVPLWPDSRDASQQHLGIVQPAAAVPANNATASTAAPALSISTPTTPTASAAAAKGSSLSNSDLHVLIFLKWLDPRTGQIAFLTHSVLRVNTPLHHLFSLVGSLVQHSPHLLSAHVETTPATWQPGANALHRTIQCPGFVADQVQGGAGGQTIRDAAIENGQILTFHLSSMTDTLEAVYRGYLDELFREAFLMYYGDGRGVHQNPHLHQQLLKHDSSPNNSNSSSMVLDKLRARRHRTLKLEEVVNLFERFGYQSFRVRNVYYQHKHQNARQTLEYVIQGRHLGFCCDRCGATDFTGPRYKCMSCYDYDLCGSCQEHPQAAAHRYKYEHRGWRRESHFNEHNKTHRMHMILPVPCKLNLLHL